MFLVHWWYYPDSYREWKPQSEIEGSPEPVMPTPVLWKVQVCCVLLYLSFWLHLLSAGHYRSTGHIDLWTLCQARFIRDLNKFNEWMNEEDYIIGGDEDDDEEDAADRGDDAAEVCHRTSESGICCWSDDRVCDLDFLSVVSQKSTRCVWSCSSCFHVCRLEARGGVKRRTMWDGVGVGAEEAGVGAEVVAGGGGGRH